MHVIKKNVYDNDSVKLSFKFRLSIIGVQSRNETMFNVKVLNNLTEVHDLTTDRSEGDPFISNFLIIWISRIVIYIPANEIAFYDSSL